MRCLCLHRDENEATHLTLSVPRLRPLANHILIGREVNLCVFTWAPVRAGADYPEPSDHGRLTVAKGAHHCHKETVPLKHGSVLAKCKWETIFCGHYRSILNHCDVIGLQSFRIRWNNARYVLLRRSGSFKVTDIGTNRKPVCNFLLVINTNWHPISYRFEVIANYCLNFGHCVFESPFGGLGATCTVHLMLIKKLVLDFLFVLTEHFQRLVLRLRRYERILTGNRRFWRGLVSFGQIFM